MLFSLVRGLIPNRIAGQQIAVNNEVSCPFCLNDLSICPIFRKLLLHELVMSELIIYRTHTFGQYISSNSLVNLSMSVLYALMIANSPNKLLAGSYQNRTY